METRDPMLLIARYRPDMLRNQAGHARLVRVARRANAGNAAEPGLGARLGALLRRVARPVGRVPAPAVGVE